MRVLHLRSCASNPEELSVETLSGNHIIHNVPPRALCVFRRKDMEEEHGVLNFSRERSSLCCEVFWADRPVSSTAAGDPSSLWVACDPSEDLASRSMKDVVSIRPLGRKNEPATEVPRSMLAPVVDLQLQNWFESSVCARALFFFFPMRQQEPQLWLT